MTSVAYQSTRWYYLIGLKTLPFDDSLMEETIIDMKVQNLFGVLGWDFSHDKEKKWWWLIRLLIMSQIAMY